MTQMPHDEVDTALILENELKRRVREVAIKIVNEEVARQMGVIFAEQKAKMMMEISISIGQMLNLIQKEDRKPLWESKPEEFGLTNKELNRSHIEKDLDHAVREQTPTI